MTITYTCDYCGDDFGDEYDCEEHEDTCEENPNRPKISISKGVACQMCEHLHVRNTFEYKGEKHYNYDCLVNADIKRAFTTQANLTNYECPKFKRGENHL